MRSHIAMALALGLLGTAAHAQSEPTTQGTYYINKSFAVSWAYPFIKLDAAYNRGWTGKGVTVAVFDTGIDARNSKFAGNLAGGYDIYTGGTVTTDPNWHGTFVSSIIAANRQATTTLGMYGVASDAKIYAVRVMDANGVGSFTDKQLATGITSALNSGSKVFNNSWNVSVMLSQLNPTQRQQLVTSIQQQLSAYAVASSKGVINVWAAGNNGLSSPGYYATLPEIDSRLKGSWLVAVAVDTNGQIATWSNRCGIAAAYCLAAPGGSIVGIYQGGVAQASGTSFAAPLVSGGAALLVQQWPYLTGAQITSILLRTANRTGVYANSSIYGAGLMDLDAATRPVGTAVIPTGSTAAGSSTALSNSGVSLGPVFGKVASASDILVLDDYGRAYGVGLQDMVQTASAGINTQRAMARWQDGSWTVKVTDDITLGLVDDASRPITGSDDQLLPVLGTPYMAMGDGRKLYMRQGAITAWATQLENRDADDPSHAQADLPSAAGMAYHLGDLDLGVMIEQNSLFGYATGHNGLGANAVTAFAGWHHSMALTDAWTLDTSASIGQTQIDHTQGFVSDVSRITSMAAAIGLSTKDLLRQGDRLGFSVGLPTTVTNGTATMDIPVSRDFDGNISYESQRLDLAGGVNRQDLQAYWRADLGHGSSMGISTAVMLRDGAVADTLTVATLKLQF